MGPLRLVIAELERSLKWRAKKLPGLSGVSDTLTGAVGAVQRVDSALRLNVHFHVLYLDGVYAVLATCLLRRRLVEKRHKNKS